MVYVVVYLLEGLGLRVGSPWLSGGGARRSANLGQPRGLAIAIGQRLVPECVGLPFVRDPLV